MRRWVLHLLSILALLSLPSIPAMPLHGIEDTPSEGGSLVTNSTETEVSCFALSARNIREALLSF